MVRRMIAQTLWMNIKENILESVQSKIKISVIVPAYNAERYIRKCLESIINQTHQNLEIICINDGSQDNTPEILNEYARTDPRILVVHQENKGEVST